MMLKISAFVKSFRFQILLAAKPGFLQHFTEEFETKKITVLFFMKGVSLCCEEYPESDHLEGPCDNGKKGVNINPIKSSLPFNLG